MRIRLHVSLLCFIFASTTSEANTQFKQDLQNLFTWHNASIMAVGLGLAGAAHTLDDNLDGQAHKLPIFKVTSRPSNIYGSGSYHLPATLGVYLFSRAIKRPQLQSVSSDLFRALLWTHALVSPVKHATKRHRPDRSNRRSFPSGHTASAFAISGVMHAHYGPRVSVPFYAWSMLVGGARLEGNRHYLSDVVAGAAFGIVVGQMVSNTRLDKKLTIMPTPLSDGLGLTMTFKH